MRKLLSGISRFTTCINKGLGSFVCYLTPVLVLLTVYDVVRRVGSVGIQELEWHIFGFLILLGAGYTLQADKHVRVDIFYARFSSRGKALVNWLGTLFFLIPFCVIVIWSSYSFVENSFRILEGSSNPGGLPYRFIIKAAIPVGFFFLFIQAISLVCDSLLALFPESEEQ